MMPYVNTVYKTPAELDYYTLNYATDGLGNVGDVIYESDWCASDPSFILSQSSFTESTATVWVAGGALGINPYYIKNTAYSGLVYGFLIQYLYTYVGSIEFVVQQYNLVSDQVWNMAPTSLLPYEMDWTCRLLEGNDTIMTSVWTATDPALVLTNPVIGMPATNTSVTLSQGTPGMNSVVTNTITTAQGRILENSFKLFVAGDFLSQ
jgi:hypothetical protein